MDFILRSLFVVAPLAALIGMAIALYETLISRVIWHTFQTTLSPDLLVFLPAVGFILVGFLLQKFKVPRTTMADEVVHAYHNPEEVLHQKSAIGKILASIATMGFGASAGLEGASKWLGALIASASQNLINKNGKFRRLHIPLRSMVIIGAAGGIAAILHAPVAGAIMAVESPYRKGLAKETLIESLLAAFVSFYAYSLILDPRPLFTYPLVDYTYEPHDLYVFVILGVCAGYSSRAMLGIWNFISLKIIPKLNHDWRIKYAIGGMLLSGIAFFALHFYGSSFTMYSGHLETNHVLDNHYALYEATGLFILKTLATIVTFAFGGVGGLFVPSATIGASLGFILQTVTKTKLVGTLPYLGIASFIGASYNSFLFSLVFLIETTQNGSLFLPGLITCGIAYFISYGISNSKSQR